MSKYTTELRKICENYAKTSGYDGNSRKEIIKRAIPFVFDFDFPIFDEDYRKNLEEKILKRYYMREIAFETVGLFKLYLDQRLNEIMTYYNMLYKSALLDFNPFYDVDLTRKQKRKNIGEEERKESGNSDTGANETAYNLYSDTPQGALNGVDSENYLTNATKTTSNSGSATTTNTEGTANTLNTEEYLEKVSGKQGTTSYSEMLLKYRETFLNIDKMVIDDLRDLFFMLY